MTNYEKKEEKISCYETEKPKFYWNAYSTKFRLDDFFGIIR